MKITILGLLICILFSCNQKQKKEIKHDFPTADAAFEYFIDTTGLIKDKNDSKHYVCKTQTKANGRKVKFVTEYNYDFFYTKEGTLTQDLDNINVLVYNSNNQIKSNYATFYGEHSCSRYIYNSKKQLIKIITWDDTNPSNVSRISSITTFIYSTNQDSVVVESKLYTGVAKDSKYKYAYDIKSNLIHDNAYPSIKLNSTDTQIPEKLFRSSEDIWSYWKVHVTYY
jgi:hypothetical protein